MCAAAVVLTALSGGCGRTPLDQADEVTLVQEHDAALDIDAEREPDADADAIEEPAPPPITVCASASYTAVPTPLDVYVMYDQSRSMSCTIPSGGSRWDAVKAAFIGFLQSPASRGIAVGIQYFGLWRGGNENALNSSCDSADYVNADVEIGRLPDNAAGIIASLNAHEPQSDTPTQAALPGAITHARSWATDHPDHKVVVLLVTDGEPYGTQCPPSADPVGDVAQIAADGVAGSPTIPTYLIGVLSPGQSCGMLDPREPTRADLNRVAQAGTGMDAFVVDTAADVSTQFVDDLNQIRLSSVLACTYVVPPPPDGGVLDFNKVNVVYEPAQGGAIDLARVTDRGRCDPDSGGWYYDDPRSPKNILLCPVTCGEVSSDAIGQLQIAVGCLMPDASK